MTAEQRALLAALRAVPGVAAADLEDDGHPGGAGVLRLRLSPGADEVAVAGAVNRVLRTRFGLVVDVDRVQVVDDAEVELVSGEPEQADEETGASVGADAAIAGDFAADVEDVEGRPVDPAEEPSPPEPRRWLGLAAVDEPEEPREDGPGDVPSPAPTAETWRPGAGGLAEEVALTRGASVRALRVGAVPAGREQQVPPRAEPEATAWAGALTGGPEPDYPAPHRPGRGLRLALERVQLRTEGLVSSAAVTLGLDEASWTGHGEAAATPTAVQRAVAVATARAVEAAIGGVARVEVEHVDVPVAGRERTALVVVSVVTGAGAERLSGASVVRQDVRQAVVRATLAAVNRRVEGWLPVTRAAG